jgi:hypothetical protein
MKGTRNTYKGARDLPLYIATYRLLEVVDEDKE